MRKMILAMSILVMTLGMTSCKGGDSRDAIPSPQKQEREFLDGAIRHRSPDLQKVDLIGNTVVYTHIFDGIIDIKTYTFEGNECVAVERVFTFPDQMSALRHYRRAVEQAELYDDIQLLKNEVRYRLDEDQYKLETKGLTKEQLKAKFDKQIADAKADLQAKDRRMKNDMKKCGECIENSMKK